MPTLRCEDFTGVGVCCTGLCHDDRNYLITVHPESCYSVKYREGKMPDLSLGISGEICCGRYEAVKRLPRTYWLRAYGKREGWSEAHIEQLVAAPPEKFYQVCGELASHYWRIANPSSAGSILRRDSGTHGRTAPVSRRASPVSKCPACGSKWDGDVCTNCGHGGRI